MARVSVREMSRKVRLVRRRFAVSMGLRRFRRSSSRKSALMISLAYAVAAKEGPGQAVHLLGL